MSAPLQSLMPVFLPVVPVPQLQLPLQPPVHQLQALVVMPVSLMIYVPMLGETRQELATPALLQLRIFAVVVILGQHKLVGGLITAAVVFIGLQLLPVAQLALLAFA
jgi:hypothetical protein